MSQLNRRAFIRTTIAAGAAVALPSRLSYAGANDAIRVGFISCGHRANNLMRSFSKIDGVKITGLCDPDQARLEDAKKKFPGAKGWVDLRGLLDDKDIDAVVIATCNHWHCLAAIWAMQAGKDVYVEKPLSHSQWEGRQVVAAARKYERICQLGTQQRSDPMQAEIKKFLHQEKALGRILTARVNRFGVRESIGKRNTPLPAPAGLAYDLWLGPAQELPMYRDKLHYDWHWVWNTGSGEMGNWGVHVLDDLRNNVFQDQVALPRRVLGGGGRVVWNDAGETPNIHFAYFDTGSIPVVIALTNLPATPGKKGSPKHPGPGSGYIAYCEGGRLEGQRRKAVAFDESGKVIKKFSGNSGAGLHQKNFIDAVRKRDASILNSDVEVGHYSTGWCNLANVAFRSGSDFSHAEAKEAAADVSEIWEHLITDMEPILRAHEIDIESAGIKLSPLLEFDSHAEKFVGPHARTANRYLTREYRKPFTVPKIQA